MAAGDDGAIADRGGRPPKLPEREGSGISSDAGQYENIVAQGADAMDVHARWLYKIDRAVFGPITSKVLLEKLYSGEIDDKTPISPEDGDFLALRRYGAFRAHLPKVEEHKKHLAEIEAERRRVRQRAIRKRTGFAVVAAVLAILVFYGVYGLVRSHREREAGRAADAKLLAEIDAMLASVTIEPPLAEIEDDPPEEPVAPGAKPGPKRPKRKVATFSGGQGGTGELTRSEIMEGIASVFGPIKKCIVVQMQANPDSVPDSLGLAFSIDNEGAVRNFAIDDRILRNEPIRPCIAGALQSVRYRNFKGEVRNVEYPITIRR